MATQSPPNVPGADLITRDPEIAWGKPVFCGTRVPVQALLDYLSAGDRLDDFLDAFPSVKREQAVAILMLASDLLELNVRATSV